MLTATMACVPVLGFLVKRTSMGSRGWLWMTPVPVPEPSVTDTLTTWSEAELEVLLGLMEGGRKCEYGVALGGRGEWGTVPLVLALSLRGGPAVEVLREGDDC
jgi:hypothetical protein